MGIAAGVLVRAAVLGHGFGRTTFTFMAVTLVVTGLLLLAWRGLLGLLLQRRRTDSGGVRVGGSR
jgi:hypothetical protein